MGFRTVKRREQVLSPWVRLVERTVSDGTDEAVYHSLAQADYVTLLAIAEDGRIPLARQYRPALDRLSLELPGGLLEPHEAPEACAVRELAEEVGFDGNGRVRLLGTLDPDSGRLENRLWAYFASGVTPIEDWQPEKGVERVMMDRETLLASVLDGRFTQGLHIAIIGMVLAGGLL